MFRQRPGRATGFSYVGVQRYFLTICTANRHPAFVDSERVQYALDGLRAVARDAGFAVLAWCFMPDHVHFLLEGMTENSNLRDVVPCWKQACGYRYQRETGARLWQSGYYDRVLREEDAAVAVARYILENPVRAGLAKQLGEYRHAGSEVWSMTELAEAFQWSRPR